MGVEWGMADGSKVYFDGTLGQFKKNSETTFWVITNRHL